MSVLITGAGGQLGSALARQLGSRAVLCGSDDLDIRDRRQVERVLQSTRPAAVVNCAAYTRVDLAEQEPEACHAVNETGVTFLADVCREQDALFVQISTDYVFGGDLRRRTPYRESDTVAPQSVYARSKLAGEYQAARCPRHYVIRTCGLYGVSPRGVNFVDKMLQLARTRDELRVVNDQRCTPTYTNHLARAIEFLLMGTAAFGTYHVVNRGSTSWINFATAIFQLAKIPIRLKAIRTEEFGAAAERPRFSVLDTTKYESLGGPRLPDWREGLGEYLAEKSTSDV